MTTQHTAEQAGVEHHTIEAAFEILEWNEVVYDEPEQGPKLTKVTVSKRYRGEIDGTGVAEVLTAQGADGSGYVASERVIAKLAGRAGTFVIQHGGMADNGKISNFGTILPHSATGELRGMRGDAHEAQRGVLTINYTLPVGD